MFTRIALFAVLLSALILLWPSECLTAQDGGKTLFAWPISAGESFEVTFTHSLNLSPVTDVIEWAGSGMIVRKSIFKTFGAGIPIPQDGAGTALVHEDGHYELIGIDKHMQSFTIITQDIPNHQITLNGRGAFLLELAGSGKVVDIAVKRVSLATRFILDARKQGVS